MTGFNWNDKGNCCNSNICRCDNIDNDHSDRGLQLRDDAPACDDGDSIHYYRDSDKYVYNDIPTVDKLLYNALLMLLYEDTVMK